MNGRRRNHLYGRQPMAVLAISLLSGLGAVLPGASPTGSTFIDLLLVGGAATAVTWAAGTAPWWAVGAACGIATLAAVPSWLLVIVGLEGVLLAAMIGANRRNQPWARSLAALSAVQVFARLDLDGFFGLSSLLAVVTLGTLFVLGVQRRSSKVRRRTWQIVAGVGVAGFIALVGLGGAATAARGPLEEGNRQAQAGLDALNRGDFEAATTAFHRAANAFGRADGNLGALWAQPARFLPVVAQHREAAVRLAAAGEVAMTAAAESVARIDPDSVRVRDGRIDLDAVRALEPSFVDLRAEIERLGIEVDAATSPWLVAPLQNRLVDLDDDIANNIVKADNALAAVRLAPDMLGGNGLRRYFIAFTTPAEARGLGGFMGNYAEITVDDGQIRMTKFGRHDDLHWGTPIPHDRVITAAPDVAGVFGGYGFVNGEDGTTDDEIWEVLTMVPDYPTVARFIAELYPQSGGTAIDGVFMLDPQAIAALIGFTGPIEVAGIDKPITARNAAQFIIEDQYKVEQLDERIDLLADVAQTTVDRLLSSTLPPPTDLARAFGPLATEGRFMAWSRDGEEQALFIQVGMSGEFPTLNGGDGVAIVIDNGGGNKIDAYLEVQSDYVAGEPGQDGFTTGTVAVTLTNNAPSGGLPVYAIGNPHGLPQGTNRLLLHVYSALGPNGAVLDGETQELTVGRVFGWYVSTMQVDIPPGESRTVVLSVQGYLQDPSQPFVTRVQPLVTLPELTVTRG